VNDDGIDEAMEDDEIGVQDEVPGSDKGEGEDLIENMEEYDKLRIQIF